MVKLSATSAAVLLLDEKKSYKSDIAKKYLNCLDLEEGQDLYKKAIKIWSHYGTVIQNRKYAIANFIKDSIASLDECQLIITGAGLDALGVELAAQYSQLKIFELDRDNMRVKAKLLSELDKNIRGKISFVKIDLLDIDHLYNSLIEYGWKPNKPTILLLEGISYYLPCDVTQKFVKKINPQKVIFEFLKYDKNINSDFRHIPEQLFKAIADLCNLSHITKYDAAEIEQLLNMNIIKKYSLSELQQIRTGKNSPYTDTEDSWIEICMLKNKSIQ